MVRAPEEPARPRAWDVRLGCAIRRMHRDMEKLNAPLRSNKLLK
jgi:hypothetical protein